MRCSWCGGEILPDMIYTYKAMKSHLYSEFSEHLSEALHSREFCSGRCLQNYIRAVLPEEQENSKAG